MEGPAPITVLLADDDERYLESLRALVEGQPELRVVGTALDGLGLIQLADELDPDAAVIDIHMPLVDGITAVARLRHDHPTICLIAITGDTDARLLRAAQEAGADAVMLKTELVGKLVERLFAARTPA